jgi:hypothetical protein
MTDNEKAATFIGWKPSRTPGVANSPAPDMSDPRNYMKALEAVSAAGYNITLEDRWQLTIDKEMPEGQEHFVVYKLSLQQHNVFVMALAALYDAEHQV